MAKSKAEIQLKSITEKLKAALKEAVKKKALLPTGEFIASIIAKRTRLGYGVKRNYGEKAPLKKLKESTILQRTKFAKSGKLSQLTRPGKSNLTRTGQLLDSLKVISVRDGEIRITPEGQRDDGKTNLEVARYQEEAGRIFNRISKAEFNQALRFYRRTFGDLLKKKRVIK